MLFDDYNIESYLVDWFEVASSSCVHTTFKKNGFCNRARYNVLTSGDLSVYNVQRDGTDDGLIKSIDGYTRITDSRFFQMEYKIIELGLVIILMGIISEPEILFMWYQLELLNNTEINMKIIQEMVSMHQVSIEI